MQIFIVPAKNRAGELATLTGALASKDVNVLITALSANGQGIASFVANDETAAQAALRDEGYEFTMFPALTVRVMDTPGQVAEISRKLGDQGVNMECFLPISVTQDEVIAAIGIEDLDVARKALSDSVVEYSYS